VKVTLGELRLRELDGKALPLKDFLARFQHRGAAAAREKNEIFRPPVYTLNCTGKCTWTISRRRLPRSRRDKGLRSVIESTKYTIENFERACLQSSRFPQTPNPNRALRPRARARRFYLWIYPNFLLNAYEGVMDTNLVMPLAVDKCAVVFDYYFSEREQKGRERKPGQHQGQRKSAGGNEAICDAVQRGLAFTRLCAGRLSVRREAGEHLFHRLLHADLTGVSTCPAAQDLKRISRDHRCCRADGNSRRFSVQQAVKKMLPGFAALREASGHIRA